MLFKNIPLLTLSLLASTAFAQSEPSWQADTGVVNFYMTPTARMTKDISKIEKRYAFDYYTSQAGVMYTKYESSLPKEVAIEKAISRARRVSLSFANDLEEKIFTNKARLEPRESSDENGITTKWVPAYVESIKVHSLDVKLPEHSDLVFVSKQLIQEEKALQNPSMLVDRMEATMDGTNKAMIDLHLAIANIIKYNANIDDESLVNEITASLLSTESIIKDKSFTTNLKRARYSVDGE